MVREEIEFYGPAELRDLEEPFDAVSRGIIEGTDRRAIILDLRKREYTPEQAERLWEHWQQPGIRWFAGGHVSFFWSSEVAPFVDHRLHKAGFAVLDR